ncbi:MAG: hypothetical protein H6883_07115 [Rhodobiaceae bacterium]|nr:hypothetical protein [Rhodobiaceae bacterium]MCC0055890.1 hypothetical protein [Rhodobiaceae bacterium]
MTPLAHKIAAQLTMPKAKRTIKDGCDLLSRMGDVHCFEVTDVFDAAPALSLNLISRGMVPEVLAFLPAPKTWIEWRFDDGGRQAFLLIETPGGSAQAFSAREHPEYGIEAHEFVGELLLAPKSWDQPFPVPCRFPGETVFRQKGWAAFLYGTLAIINTPRIFGRRQHMPHRGLERKLLQARAVVGKFPLHAWTEIQLRVKPPKDASGDPSHEAHLTGRKALHFCRSHLRIRRGQLEFVSAHWRGDAALGIKRSRYRVTQ